MTGRRRAWIAAAGAVLRLALPADEAQAVLGDLIEDAGARQPARVFAMACGVAAHRILARVRSAGAPDAATLLGSLAADARLAVRSLAARPGYMLTVIITLTLAIGASTAMFAIVDAVLLRPLPFASGERAVWIASFRADNPDAPVTLPEFMDYRATAASLDGLAAYANWSASLAGDGVTERLQGARISANAFDVLGVAPAAGRLLQDADDRPDAVRVVVISHRLWQRRFGGDPAVVGRSVRINAEPYIVIGVLPPGFTLPLRDIDVMTALIPDRDPLRHLRASTNFLRMFGRLKPDVTLGQAEQELSAVCAELRRRFPAEYARKEGIRVRPLKDAIVGSHASGLTPLFSAVLIVMAAALANLLCLVLVRSHDRRPEISIRMALGASRPRLWRQLAIEAGILVVAGSAAARLLAGAIVAVAPSWAPASIPRLSAAAIDARAMGFGAALALASAAIIAAGAAMTLLASRKSLGLRPAGRATGGDRWHRRVRDGLVAGEIASAVALLLATALLVHSLRELQRVHTGFDPDPVYQARVSLPAMYESPADVARFVDRLADRLSVLPGVRHVGLVSVAPLSGLLLTVPFAVEGQPRESASLPNANLRAITPQYLDAAGTRLLRGRGLTASDREGAAPVALVSAALADRLLGPEPIGRRLLIDDNNTGPRPLEVVGVVENVRQVSIDGPPTLDVYMPLHQLHPDGVAYVRHNQFWMIRTDGDPASIAAPFASALRAIDRDAAISDVGTMRQYVDAWFGPLRFSLGLFAAFSLTAVLLSVSGLYGLIAYTVSQRRREIGLRLALGASARQVQRLFLVHAATLAAAGIAVGTVAAMLAKPLASLLTAPIVDGRLLVVVPTGLFTIVLLAAWVPARRAAGVAPTIALRSE